MSKKPTTARNADLSADDKAKPRKSKPTVQRINELFSCNPLDGVLRWKVDRTTGRGRVTCKAGSVAGCLRKDNQRIVSVDGVDIRVHRVIWVLFYGEWPKDQVDHINRNRLDNRICNLRIANNSQNNANRGLQSNNTSGAKGVHFDKSKKKWVAYIKIMNKRKHLGSFDSFPEAAKVRSEAAKKAFGEFSCLEAA